MPTKKQVKEGMKEKAIDKIPFPKCSEMCRVIDELGAGECENVCPQKFKPPSPS